MCNKRNEIWYLAIFGYDTSNLYLIFINIRRSEFWTQAFTNMKFSRLMCQFELKERKVYTYCRIVQTQINRHFKLFFKFMSNKNREWIDIIKAYLINRIF